MLRRLVPLLCCPWCGGEDLALSGTQERVSDGTLVCQACGRATTIEHGVWKAMGPHRRQRSIAQLTNVWPNALFYESLWRPGALSRFTGRRFPLSEELGELCAALQPAPGRTMVDVACSEGLYARALAANGATVFAVEHSLPMLHKVVRRSGGLPVVAVQAVAQHLPFRGGSLDGVAIGGSLNEIGNRSEAIAEMTRVLHVSGHGAGQSERRPRLFTMHLNRGRTGPGRLLQAGLAPSGIVFDSADGWRRALTDAGLTVDSEHIEGIVTRMALHRTALS